MNNRSEKLRAILLSVLMIGSVMALGVAMTGPAAAVAQSNSAELLADSSAAQTDSTHTVRFVADGNDEPNIEAIELDYTQDGNIGSNNNDVDVSGVQASDISLRIVDTDGTDDSSTSASDFTIQTGNNGVLDISVESSFTQTDNLASGDVIIMEIDNINNADAGTFSSVEATLGVSPTRSDGTGVGGADTTDVQTVDYTVGSGPIDVAGTPFDGLHNALDDANSGETITISDDVSLLEASALQPTIANNNLVVQGDGSTPTVTARPNTAFDPLLDVNADNATIQGLDFAGGTQGIEAVVTRAAASNGVTISDNSFDGFTGTSVIDAGDSNTVITGPITITNNTLGSNNNVDPAITVDGDTANVSENTINQVNGEGINVKDIDGSSLVLGNNSITFAGNNNGIDIVSTSGDPSISITADSQNPASIGQIGGTKGSDAVEIAGITTNGGLTIDGLKVANVDQGIDVSSSDTITGDVTFTNLNLTKAGESSSAIAYSVADSSNVGTVTFSNSLVDNANTDAAIDITSDGSSAEADELVLENLNVSNVGSSGNGEAIDVGGSNTLADAVTISGLEFNNVGEGLDFGNSNDVLTGAAQVEVSGVTGNDLTGGDDGSFGVRLADSSARDAVIRNVTFTQSDDITAATITAGTSTTTANITNVDVSGVSGSANTGTAAAISAGVDAGIIDDVTADNVSQVVAASGLGQAGSTLDVTNIVAQDLGDSADDINLDSNARVITVQTVDIDGATDSDDAESIIDVSNTEGDPGVTVQIDDITINNTASTGIRVSGVSNPVGTLDITNVEATNLTDADGGVIDVDEAGEITDTTISSVTATSNDADGISINNLGADSDTVTISDSNFDHSGNNNGIGIGTGSTVDIASSLDISNVTINNTDIGVNLGAGATGRFSSATDVQLRNLEITNASTSGVDIADGGPNNVNVTDTTFADNDNGVRTTGDIGGSVVINVTQNSFTDHNSNAILLQATNGGNQLVGSEINVSFNHFNATSGPTIVDNDGSNIDRYALGDTFRINNNAISGDNTNNIVRLPFTTESGEVVRAATGQLTDPSGNGIADQEVTFSLTDVDTGNNKTVTFSELSNSNDAGTSQDGDYVIAAETGTTDFVTFDVTASTAGFAETDTNRFTLGNDEFLTTGFDLQANDAAQINGTATGPSGDALTNTQLQVLDAASGDQLATATTDSDGVFTFDVSPLSSDTVFINDTAGTFPDSSEATVTVDTGEQVNQSFTLGGQLNGTVFFPNETATDNTEIDFTVNNGAETVVSTTTDENGSYTVDITAREGSDGARDYTLQAENSSFDPSDATDVTITEGEVTTQNFTLKSLNTATLTATIQNGTSGEALTDTEVTLTAGDNAPGSLNATRTTDSNGQITLRIPASDPPTAYDITANADGFSSASVGFAPAAGESVSRTFSLEEAADEQPPTATVTFGGEDGLTVVNGSTSVNVASARFDGTEDFVIVVHRASPGDNGVVDGPSEINAKIGSSDVLSGNVSDVSVNLTKNLDEDGNTQLTENQTLVAMLHFANESRPGDRNFDTSIKRSGSPVFDQADITIVDAPRVGGSENPAGNTDEDAQLEDVDGDGDAGFNDAIVLATNLDDPGVEDNPQFDFDGDGDVDFNDAIVLATS